MGFNILKFKKNVTSYDRMTVFELRFSSLGLIFFVSYLSSTCSHEIVLGDGARNRTEELPHNDRLKKMIACGIFWLTDGTSLRASLMGGF